MRAGAQVTLLQRPVQLMNNLDYDMATLLHTEVREHGIDLRLKADVTGFEEVDGRVVTHVAGDDPIGADMVLLAIGVAPESHLAQEAGLELGIKGLLWSTTAWRPLLPTCMPWAMPCRSRIR